MRQPVLMPEIGEGVTEAFVVEWLLPVGALVRAGDPLVEVMTDKANVEVECTVDGTVVEHCVGPEARVEIGQVLAYVQS